MAGILLYFKGYAENMVCLILQKKRVTQTQSCILGVILKPIVSF